MESVLNVLRYERKYTPSYKELEYLKRKLKFFMNLDNHSNNHKGYKVRSVYFDSYNDCDYKDKLDGLNVRKKIRIRIYDEDDLYAKIEVKNKIGDKQKKTSIILSKEDAIKIIKKDFSPLLKNTCEHSLWLYSVMSKNLYRPVCMIEYDRYAFTHESNKIRVTIDSDIKYSITNFNIFDKSAILIPCLNTPVLEVKYNGYLLDPVRKILANLSLVECAVSKYVMARKDIE